MTRERARREVDSLDFYLQNHTDDYGEESHTAMMMAKEALNRSENPNKWIPVSEMLPESCGMYIVTRKIYDCPDTAPIIMSDESWFDGQNTWHNDNRINHDRGYLSDVVAWMPLPEPYKVSPTGAEGSEE